MTINYDAAKTVLSEERAKLIHQLDELGATESGDLRSDVQFGDGFADAGAATAERTEVIGLVESLKLGKGEQGRHEFRAWLAGFILAQIEG